MPFFEFLLVMVGISTLAILLTAQILTATARLHLKSDPWTAPIAPEKRPPAAIFAAKVDESHDEGNGS